MSVEWQRGVLGKWLHLLDAGDTTGYLIDYYDDKVVVEHKTSKGYEKVATFDTEEEARAYAEVCYRMGVYK